MDKQTFREQYSEDPKREDLTVLVPKQDDPTEQVPASCCPILHMWCVPHALANRPGSNHRCLLAKAVRARLAAAVSMGGCWLIHNLLSLHVHNVHLVPAMLSEPAVRVSLPA